jgi:hypothetical protein
MGAIAGFPRLLRAKDFASVSTSDKRLMRVIVIQEALAGLNYDEAKFVLDTVRINMQLNDDLRAVNDGREE